MADASGADNSSPYVDPSTPGGWKRVVFPVVAGLVVLVLSLIASLIVLGSVELVLRILNYPPQKQAAAHMPGNQYLLWELKAGGPYGSGVRINAIGLRGPDLKVPKPNGVRRFVTLGDSTVYGVNVADEATFSAVLARELGGKVEAINAGVPGYSSAQSFNLLRMRILQLQPDLFIIGNLWSDNNFDSFVDADLLSYYGGFEGTLVSTFQRLFSRTALYRFADWTLGQGGQDAQRIVGWRLLQQDAILSRRRVAIEAYAKNLDLMVKLALDHGAEVLFVILPNTEDFQKASRPWPWDVYRRAMRDTAARYGAPVVDAAQLFRDTGKVPTQLLLDAMHPRVEGHRLIARALAGILKERKWAEGGRVMAKSTGGRIPHYVDPFVYETGRGTGQKVQEELCSDPGHSAGHPDIAGVVRAATSMKRGIRLEAIAADGSGAVVDAVELPQSAAFALMTGRTRRVFLRVTAYADAARRVAGAEVVDLSNTLLDLSQGPAWGVVVDVGARTVTRGERPGWKPPRLEARDPPRPSPAQPGPPMPPTDQAVFPPQPPALGPAYPEQP